MKKDLLGDLKNLPFEDLVIFFLYYDDIGNCDRIRLKRFYKEKCKVLVRIKV